MVTVESRVKADATSKCQSFKLHSGPQTRLSAVFFISGATNISAIPDDDEYVHAGLEKGERTVVVNPRELALQPIEDGRIREFEIESGLKGPA